MHNSSVHLKRANSNSRFCSISNLMSRFFSRLKEALDINSSDMSGCCDVIVVADEFGVLHCTPFHLRIGTVKLLHHKLAQVQIVINGQFSKQPMCVNNQGVGYFQVPLDESPEMNISRPLSPFRGPMISNQTKLTIFGKDIEETRSRSMLPMERSYNSQLRDTSRSYYPRTKSPLATHENQQTTVLFKEIKRTLEQNDRIRISICGHLITPNDSEGKIQRVFEDNMIYVSKHDAELEQLLNDERLMLKIDGLLYDYNSGITKLVQITLEPANGTKNQTLSITPGMSRNNRVSFSKLTKESNKPPTGFFKGLNLNVGLNQLEYRFRGNFNSESVIKCRLFYYTYQVQHRLLISDIDGTITKSDLLGMVLPIVSLDWSHADIVQLYTKLVKRGYTIIYLTARNTGLYQTTLDYLKSLTQNNLKLPEGPLVMNPASLMESFKQDIILKTAHHFKTQVLQQLNSAFCPLSTYIPLFAGIGNQKTDSTAYQESGIPKRRIFTIKPDGQISVLKTGESITYSHLHENIDDAFPVFDPNERPKMKTKVHCFENPPSFL